jgi:hypothetical protein
MCFGNQGPAPDVRMLDVVEQLPERISESLFPLAQPFPVIPAKAGTQNRGVVFLIPISAEFFSFFVVRASSGSPLSRG